jgi:phosphonate dehydrogenase
MNRPIIVATHRIHDEVAERLRQAGELRLNTGPEPWSPAELRARLQGASALMGFMTDRVDAELLAATPSLRIVACALKGPDSYDEDACTRAGVWMSIVPDLLTAPTAELAIGLAIGLGRNLREGDARVRSGAHRGWRAQLYGTGLDGSVAAVLGLGLVGRGIAARLQGFGCRRVLGFDPSAAAVPGVEPCTLEQAVSLADWLFVAVPLTPSTRHLVGASLLHDAKPGQLVVNVGRGSVVDEEAVAAALRSGRLGGYAADVFEFEDWSLPDAPTAVPDALRTAERTLFTPHIGSAVTRVRLEIEHRAASNILAVLANRRPPDAVNEVLADMAVGM